MIYKNVNLKLPHLALLPRGGILELGVIARVHQAAAHSAELALPRHGEEGPVKEGMILPEILLLPVASHLCLLVLCLDQLDVQVLRPARKAIYFDVGQKLHKCILNDSDNDS